MMGPNVSGAPLISIIVPSFNELPSIMQESLSSIARQTFTNFECIVVDESTEIALASACRNKCAEDSRFIYIRPEKRLGLPGSLNLGLQVARGEWVARFDIDDICVPERLALQIAFLHRNPGVDVLGGAMEVMDEMGNPVAYRRYPHAHNEIEKRIHFSTPLGHPTVVFRRQTVVDAGGYNSELRFAEDLDLWLRLLNRGVRFANLEDCLIRYRQHEPRRHFRHWTSNLRVRIKNLRKRFIVRRIAGMAFILIWSLTPPVLQKTVYSKLIFGAR